MATVQSKKRPIAITILGWLFIAVGALSTAAHYANFRAQRPMVNEVVWITTLGSAAVVAGAYMLRGHNWARWLALAWIAAHVVISAFHPLQELIVHGALFLLFSYFLFRREAREYFAGQ